MNRGVGEIEAAQRLVPEWLYPLLEATTRLGDVSVLVAVTIAAVLVLERDRAVALFGIVIGGFALLAGLKATFGFPRPPAEVQLVETATTGFPSGHALGATVVYGALALAVDVGSRRARYVAVAILVSAISLSRVVLGVHYLADIAVGGATAVGYLWLADRSVRAGLGRTLAVALSLGVAAVAAAAVFGPTPRTDCLEAVCLDQDAAMWAGAAVGAATAWGVGDRWPTVLRPAFAFVVAFGLLAGGAVTVLYASPLLRVIPAAFGAAALVLLSGRGARVRQRLQ